MRPWGPSGGEGQVGDEPTLTFFLRRRWTRAASCSVLSVSVWWAGASETWAIMVARQLLVARDSRSSMVSLCSLGVEWELSSQGPARAGGWASGTAGLEGGRQASHPPRAGPGAAGSGLAHLCPLRPGCQNPQAALRQ